MKNKILSLALVLGILLSVFGSIPVSASTTIERGLPYAFFDYEDDVISFSGATITSGGMAQSGKCMKFVEKSATYTPFSIVSGNDGKALTGTIPAGYTFKMSFNLKIPQKLTAGDLLLSVSGSGETEHLLGSFDPENTTNWQKVVFSHTPETDWTDVSLLFRFATHGATGDYVLGGEKTDPRTFFIDDMEVSVMSPELLAADTDADKVNSLADYKMGFENGSSVQTSVSGVGHGVNASTALRGIASHKVQLIKDPTNVTNTVLKVWLASDMQGSASTVKLSNSTASGVANVPVAMATVPSGGKITYTFRYYLPQEMESSNNPAFCIVHATGLVFATSSEAFATTSGQWHTATLTYTNTSDTAKEIGGATLRTCSNVDAGLTNWTLKGKPGVTDNSVDFGEREIYFDDIRVVLEENVSGGSGTGETTSPAVADKVDTINDYRMSFENGASIQMPMSGVGNANANSELRGLADEKIQLITDPADNTNTVLKVWMSSTRGGGSSALKFSNTTSAAAGAGLAGGTIPAGDTITYKFRYYLPQDMKSDNNPGFVAVHNIGSGYYPFATGTTFETTAREWHEATLTFTNTTSSDMNVSQVIFRYCNNEGSTSTWTLADVESGYGEREIYFDDFRIYTSEYADSEQDDEDEIVEPTPEPDLPEESVIEFPVSSELLVTGNFTSGEKVTFSHNFVSPDESAEDYSLVKLMNVTDDGEQASLGSCRIGELFTVPVLPVGGTYFFEVVPVDSGNRLGSPVSYTYAQIVGQDIKLKLSDFTADGSVTATVMMDNQRADGTNITAILAVFMLNERGAVVKYELKPIVCANGSSIMGDAGKVTLTTDNADPAQSKITHASAFLWDCTGGLPTWQNSVMEELAPDMFVEK